MSELARFGISVEEELLKKFDDLIGKQGYANRSEAFRDLMRDALVKSQLENNAVNGEVVGSLTFVYDHHARELNDKMNDLQHQHYHLVVSVTHVHISHDDCLEVIVLRGEIPQIKSLANSLLSLKGVKHGQLFITLPSKNILNTDA